MSNDDTRAPAPGTPVEQPARILVIRRQLVILDEDLARLYGIETRILLQAVRRNATRFPPEFVMRLNPEELRSLRSQIVISKGRGGRRSVPYAFTEHGVAMMASVLRSERAISVNIEIVRSFIRMRQREADIAGLGARLDDLEQRYDGQFKQVFDAIRRLMRPPDPDRKPIGF